VVTVREKGQKDEEYQQAWKLVEQEAAQEDPVSDDRKVEEAEGPWEATWRGRKARTEGILEIKDGLLYRKGMLWIPEDRTLKQTILESEHDSKVAGHMGKDKTAVLVRRNFWWPKMEERIIDFILSCPEYQQNKAIRHQPYGLSSPLEFPYAPWQSIAMDFITELPVSEDCDQLWVVIDQFTKMVHFHPQPKDKKTASDLAVTFAREIWKYHGLPTDIVSDRDS